jgi:hypothetical protein
MRLFVGLLLISTQLFAGSWHELEINKTYELNQGFQLPQKERSGALLDFLPGDQFTLKEITGLDMINVVLFHFDYHNCPGPQMSAEMEIIPVQGTGPVVEIGAQLEPKCELQIFIESKDLMTKSMFQ